MTRKRYIKLLMADGYSRNKANAKAKIVQISGCNYSNMYITEKIKLDEWNQSLLAMQKSLEVAERVFYKVIKKFNAICKALFL